MTNNSGRMLPPNLPIDPATVHITFIDVGQGDSALICLPQMHAHERRAILIDCPAGNAPKVLALLREQQITELALVIVTHSDNDHCGGILDIVEDFAQQKQQTVVIAYLPDSPVGSTGESSRTYKQFIRRFLELRQQKIIDWLRPNLDQMRFDGVVLDFLHPEAGDTLAGLAAQDRNTPSQVILLNSSGTRVLFAADITATGWQSIMQRQMAHSAHTQLDNTLHAQVLKVPHHGGAWQSSEAMIEMLRIVQPEYVVISTGSRNSYGHPTEQFFQALRETTTVRRVLCTQATHHLCAAQPRSVHVCAGSVELHIGTDTLEIRPALPTHLARMEGLKPACSTWLPEDAARRLPDQNTG